ncbi:sigma-70 family RNA polymerase sigma factor [Thermomicrobium sp. 4228-Ro]|uniref:RNA polymerase sigma factor n=1 Tax=Thermomicrobium sp. 4228-Ro TaxID=2993937 RepID=UPI002248AEB9|nr:sigma-70 family RNA polymerase sigma factor [Thermomicrobium sp. 4228-Ro]MCX2725934.1 sigma-70 family RNA polymerase sigma factor [Thermomicrobium sp. 4228-Ro]
MSVSGPMENERERLLTRIEEHLRKLGEEGGGAPTRREWLVQQIVDHYRPLRRFVRREIGRYVAFGVLPSGMLNDEEVTDTVLVRALQHWREAPERGLFRWLRRTARRTVRQLVDQERRRIEHERSLEEPVGYQGDEWPDQVVRLIDILADPKAEIPEQVVLAEETQRILDEALDRLPETWREVFLLKVDGWTDEQIALTEGLAVDQVGRIVEASRAFLADLLRERRQELEA